MDNETNYDYSKHNTGPSKDGLARLTNLADEQVKRELELEQAEAELVRVKKELADIAEVGIPELMIELGVETIKTLSGVTVDIKETTRASVRKNQQAGAFGWLRENGHEALIKRVIQLQFGMGEDELAQETLEKLEGLDLSDKSSVHAQTLAKFVKELKGEGKEVPEEFFSVHVQRVSKVKV